MCALCAQRSPTDIRPGRCSPVLRSNASGARSARSAHPGSGQERAALLSGDGDVQWRSGVASA
eukprot:11851851-Alexandrium_andersonii.AAC.1